MPAHFLASPFALWFLAALYRAYRNDGGGAIWLVPPLVVLVIIFVLAPQINWWWWKRNTPDLSEGLTKLLEKHCIFYKKLPINEQKAFRGKVFMFMQASDFMAKGFPEDEVPDDLRAIIAANAVTISCRKTDFLFPKFEQIAVYMQAFPTPRFPVLHSSEIFEDEGLLIFSGELLVHAFIQPGHYFNIGLYEFARAARKSWPETTPWPIFSESDWPRFLEIMPFDKTLVEAQIGLPSPDLTAVAAHHFFQNREKMAAVFPKESADFEAIFG